MTAVPRISRLFAIILPFAAIKFPSVIISPRAPKFPSVEIVPRTKRFDPVLTEPVKRPEPSISVFPNTLTDPWAYREYPGSVTNRSAVACGFPTKRVLVYVGPYTDVVDNTLTVVALIYGVLT